MKSNLLKIILSVAVVFSFGNVAMGAVFTHFEFADGTIGTNLNNSDTTRTLVMDTAPVGTAEYHDDFNDGLSLGPQWVSTGSVGDGMGLEFDRYDDAGDRTRVTGWMATSQGSYTQGASFTIMARVKPTEAIDGNRYQIYGLGGYEMLNLVGTSLEQLTFNTIIRDGTLNGGGEVRWELNSGVTGPEMFVIDPDKWYNLFMIYNANTSLTVAADDGTTFQSMTDTVVPAGFDSLLHGIADGSRHFSMGSIGTDNGTFHGTMESIRVFDGALTLEDADAWVVPEPATISLLGLGLVALLRRRR